VGKKESLPPAGLPETSQDWPKGLGVDKKAFLAEGQNEGIHVPQGKLGKKNYLKNTQNQG